MTAVKPPALLLGGGSIAVSVARSLGRLGVEVHATGDLVWDVVRHSRYCTSFTELGSGMEERLEWLERGPRGAVLLPCDDDGLELVARHRDRLVELGYVPVEADDAVLLDMLDKHRTYELAAKAGVPAPRTVTVRTEEDAERAATEIGFPCALKPVHSHQFAAIYGPHKKVWVVSDPDELRENLARMVDLELEMLVTEILPGRDDQYISYYSYLDERGEPLFHFTKRKLRQYPIRFGLACYQVTVWDEEVAALGLRFFQGVGLRGIGNVEFKRDPRDGVLKLIECNHRFTAANDLVRASGIDVAELTYKRLAGLPVPRFESFREGVHMWHAAEDVRALIAYRQAGELTLGRWALSLLHPQHFPVLDFGDMKPALANYRRMVQRVLRPGSTPARGRPG
jgi:predicted ATP-grasp superfamily ATP-dependent carboligase